MELLNNSVEYFRRLVSTQATILVTAHYNPDGDTIGASLALYHFLSSLGHSVKVLVPNTPPAFLNWMPGSDKMIIYQLDPLIGDRLINSSDVIFCMDYNATSRVKFFTQQLSDCSATKVLIDHHPSPENEFDLSISETSVSSTSELLYLLLSSAGFENSITKEMAECLFVGIMTDTGSFSYSCNRPDTFSITASLISKGIDVEKIHKMIYDTYSESRMRLLGHCLSDRMRVFPESHTAYIWLTKEDLAKFNYQPGDTEGVVNYALSIEDISLAALFMEREDRVRISLRSKGDFSVNDFARKHFQGGGHRNAAGADSFKTIDDTLSYFESLIREYSTLLHDNLVKFKSFDNPR